MSDEKICWNCAHLGSCQEAGLVSCDKFEKTIYFSDTLTLDKLASMTNVSVKTVRRWKDVKGLKYALKMISERLSDEDFDNYYEDIKEYLIKLEKQKEARQNDKSYT